MSWLIVNLLILLANLGILGIAVKVYTEILKDRKFDSRAQSTGHDGGRSL